MSVIKKLERDRLSRKITVFFSDGESCEFPPGAVGALGLAVGLEAGDSGEFCARERERFAYLKAIGLLSVRSRGTASLARMLRERGFTEDEAESAVRRLEAEGYVNDAGYAEREAERLILEKFLSPRLAEYELCRLGIDRDTAAEAVASVDFDEETILLALAEKNGGKSPEKLAALFERHGFKYREYKDILREIREAEKSEEGTDGETDVD